MVDDLDAPGDAWWKAAGERVSGVSGNGDGAAAAQHRHPGHGTEGLPIEALRQARLAFPNGHGVTQQDDRCRRQQGSEVGRRKRYLGANTPRQQGQRRLLPDQTPGKAVAEPHAVQADAFQRLGERVQLAFVQAQMDLEAAIGAKPG